MVAQKRFGVKHCQTVKKKPTAYKPGNKVPRGEEPMGPHTGWDGKDQYTDCFVRDEHNSEFERRYWSADSKTGAAHEMFDGNGNGVWRGPDSSEMRVVNGTSNFHGKNGGIKTMNSNETSATYGGQHNVSGQDGKAGGKHLGRAPGGGVFNDIYGHMAQSMGGSQTVLAMAPGIGGGIGVNSPGKITLNGEKGVGFGVNQSSDKQVYTRMEPDGTFHIQVKPKGQEGGAAVVKILPSGEIQITSESSMSVDVAQSINMKAAQAFNLEAPSFNVKAATNIDGEVTTTASIKSSGVHKASGHV